MPTFYELLKPSQQKRLAEWYKKKFRRIFKPPGHRPEIEKDIDRIMRETGKEVRP
jgi:hypothetical protein